jgi:hypothetical protein
VSTVDAEIVSSGRYRWVTGHSRFHIDQMRRTLDALRRSPSSIE